MKNAVKSVKDVINKLLYILNAEQKRLGVLIFFAGIIGALLEMLGVSAILPLVDALVTPEELAKEPIIKWVADLLHIQDTSGIVIMVITCVVLIYILKCLFFIFLSWIRAKYAAKVKRELSIQVINSYIKKGYPFFLTKNTSELSRGVFGDTNSVYGVINYSFKLIVDIMTIVLICAYMFITDWSMAVAMAGLALVCVVIIYGFFKGRMQKTGKEAREYSAIVSQQALQLFHGIKEVIVMHKQNYFLQHFQKATVKQNNATVSQTVGTESPAYVIEAICITGLLVVVGLRMMTGGETAMDMIPTLSTFAVSAFRILPSLGKVSSGINTIIFYLPGMNSAYQQLKDDELKFKEMEKNVVEAANKKSTVESEKIKLEKELQVQGVYWTYGKDKDYVLKNVDLTVKKGESVALIGQSGAGKTTLADIMLGLLQPQKGKVALDGRDILTIGEGWRNIMGYVPQSVYLTDDSIRKNIAFGVEEKDIDDTRIWAVLEQAQLKEFVEGLSQKLDTPIGERGVRFSGGQRQRMAIARALYENPDILILDEATAALDNETEEAVMSSIEALQGTVTLIIIAHRLSTIQKCDKVYEVRDGGILERDKKTLFS